MKIAKIVLRNDSTTNWNSVGDTAILLRGEVGVEFPDEGGEPKLKVGDGITVWNDLPYLKTDGSPADVSGLEDRVTLLEETVGGFDIRIQNTESGVTAAVTAADEAKASVETFKEEVNASLETQNEAISAAQAKVDENAAVVEAVEADVETVKNTQDTQEMKINAANSRVDVLVSGFTDNAEFDNAELLDIRAGYDGTTN